MRPQSAWKISGRKAIVAAHFRLPFEPFDAMTARRTTFAPKWLRLGRLAALCCAAAACCSTGCVQRRLTIRSNPPGALVIIDQHNIGITPCSTDYIYYGKRHIQLIRDGYETVDVDHWMLPPWYEIPPIDLVSENFVPYELRDERTVDFQLIPLKVTPTQPLLARAENLRQSTHLESVSPSRTPGWFSGWFNRPQAPSPHAVPLPVPGTSPGPIETLPPPPGVLPAPAGR